MTTSTTPELRSRDDDGQHGTAAPQHARRVADRAGAVRRGSRQRRHHHRVPAHRHREDGGTEEVAAGDPARRAHGLPRRAVQQPGVLPLGGEAARRRRAGAREGHPRAHRRAAAHRQPPGVARHARPRDRRRLGDDVLLPRARAAAQHQRDARRLPHVPELPADRRAARGPADRLPRRGHDLSRQVSEQAGGVRRSPDQEPDLAEAHQGRRRAEPAGRARLRAARAR